jgi:iron complex outermembrane receptor protein
MDLADILDQVVVTATKDLQRVQDAPAIVSVVTREEMERWGYRSVAEALSHVAGFYVLDDHVLPNVAVRGVSAGLRGESSILKVMVNGHSVGFRPTSGNWLGPELIPLSAVERLEIIRGPASALYGADAFLGVVNIITRSPEKLAGGAMTTTAMLSGENPGGGHDMAVGARQGAVSGLAAFRFHYENRSGLELPLSSPAPRLPAYARERRANDLTQYSGSAFGLVSHEVGPHTVTVTSYASLLDRGAEFADWLQLASGVDAQGRANENRVSLAQGFLDVRYEGRLHPKLDFSADLLGFMGGPTLRDRVEVGSDLYYVRRKFLSRGVDVDLSLRWRPLRSLTLMAGLTNTTDLEDRPRVERVLKLDRDQTLRAGDVVSATPASQPVALTNAGAQLQSIWSPIPDRLTLTTGLRYDYHTIYGSQFSVRVASVFKPTETLALKAFYGSAFKAPSAQLLYGTPLNIGDIVGNPDLEASHVHTLETLVAYQLTRYVSWSTGLVYSALLNKAEFTPQGVNLVARNVATVVTYGLESQLDVTFRDWVRAYGNVSFNRTQRRVDVEGYQNLLVGTENVLSPSLVANGGVQVSMPGMPLRAGTEVTAVSSRRASEANILENGANYTLPPYFLVGAHVGLVGVQVLPGRATAVTMVVRNLLDDDTPDPGLSGVDYPRERRTVLLHVSQAL